MSGVFNSRVPELVTGPAAEPISTADMKTWLRVDGSDEDTLISSLVKAARRAAENYTYRAFITQTWKLTLDYFPARQEHYGGLSGGRSPSYDAEYPNPYSFDIGGRGDIELPRPPIQSITSIVTYDKDNDSSTYSSSNYTVDTALGRVLLNNGAIWPSDLRHSAAIEVTYVAGYGDEKADVPDDIIHAIRAHVQAMYEHRGVCAMPEACKALLDAYRQVPEFGIV